MRNIKKVIKYYSKLFNFCDVDNFFCNKKNKFYNRLEYYERKKKQTIYN